MLRYSLLSLLQKRPRSPFPLVLGARLRRRTPLSQDRIVRGLDA
ncbi:hypothetical protein THTE_2796 [Thermogutta terrifontis]|uniref:Uncharacterized protein n=1 Tax=Thermogutta terrifontis TaxID=1331910 RepID=A0A286RHG8_9BACT|nr:hypothetical protein THTE_2796 [Thermogutta terrifontis]